MSICFDSTTDDEATEDLRPHNPVAALPSLQCNTSNVSEACSFLSRDLLAMLDQESDAEAEHHEQQQEEASRGREQPLHVTTSSKLSPARFLSQAHAFRSIVSSDSDNEDTPAALELSDLMTEEEQTISDASVRHSASPGLLRPSVNSAFAQQKALSNSPLSSGQLHELSVCMHAQHVTPSDISSFSSFCLSND